MRTKVGSLNPLRTKERYQGQKCKPTSLILQQNDTPLCLAYTALCLHDIMFCQYNLLLRLDDITFRQHCLSLRDDITFRLHYTVFRPHVSTPLPSNSPSNRGKTSAHSRCCTIANVMCYLFTFLPASNAVKIEVFSSSIREIFHSLDSWIKLAVAANVVVKIVIVIVNVFNISSCTIYLTCVLVS